MCAKNLIKLFTCPQLDMTKLCPGNIVGHKLIKGEQKSQTGAIERLDYKDGTFAEIENMTLDPESMTQVYRTLNNDRKCFEGVSEITETFTISPVTYANCLLQQAALDSLGIENSMSLVEWKIELSDPVEKDQISLIRQHQLDSINDFQINY